MNIDGVKVTADTKEFSAEELKYYVELVKSKFKEDKILTLTVSLEPDGRARLDYTKQGTKFERIRRVTGYLTGSLDSWNDAKRAEESERVKHFAEF